MHMSIPLNVHSQNLGTSSLKPHLLRRRVNSDLPILSSCLLDSILSDGLGFYISGRVLDRWGCWY